MHESTFTQLFDQDKLCWIKAVLVKSETLVLFASTLTANDKFSHRNRENFAPLIHMQLSKTPKIFSEISIAFLKYLSNFEHFGEKDQSHSISISEIIDSERCAYLKSQKATFQKTHRWSTCYLVSNTAEISTIRLSSHCLEILT